MAPAIVHFLVGASVFLLVATPFVLRYAFGRRWGIWLVPLGGIWGLIPDFHNVTPLFHVELYRIHNSPLVDLFAFHYTLDTPTVRALPNESTFASILLFLMALVVFSSAQTVYEREMTARTPIARVAVAAVATLIAAGYAATAWGIVARVSGEFPTLAAMVGQDSLLIGWVVLVAYSLVGGACLAGVMLVAVPPRYAIRPVASALVGGLCGVGVWLVGASVLAPLWLRIVFGSSVEIPHFHGSRLAGLVVFGIIFGAAFAIVRGAFICQK